MRHVHRLDPPDRSRRQPLNGDARPHCRFPRRAQPSAPPPPTASAHHAMAFGGAPNMGSDARGRRHATATWLAAGREARNGHRGPSRGRKLVVQMVETFREHMEPAFVERLDAWELAESANMALPPIMIYGDDVTHILTEEGIANLLLCRDDGEREQAIRGVAGGIPVGL